MAMAIVSEQLGLGRDATATRLMSLICLHSNVVVVRLMKIRAEIVRVCSRRSGRSRNGFRIQMQEAMGLVEIEFPGIRVTAPWLLSVLDLLLLCKRKRRRMMVMLHNLLQILILIRILMMILILILILILMMSMRMMMRMMLMMMVGVAVIRSTIRIRQAVGIAVGEPDGSFLILHSRKLPAPRSNAAGGAGSGRRFDSSPALPRSCGDPQSARSKP
jgi:hypothetical protein